MRRIERAPAWVRMAARVVRHLPAGRYRAMNQICKRPVEEFLKQLPEETGGYTFRCNLRDSIAREVCFTGQYEPQQTALLRALLKQGMTFVDVGAHWGYFTLLAAHLVGPRGRVISLEPHPRLFRMLDDNISRNKLSHATALQVAASSETGRLALAGFDERDGNWGLSRVVEQEKLSSDCVYDVAARSVDSLLDEYGIESVDVLKMDIEGAEDLALRGMKRGLEEARYKRVLLEVHPSLIAERGGRAEDVLQLLKQAGYRGWVIDHSPAATKRAAYARTLRPQDYLRPLSSGIEKENWPHILWLSPKAEASAW